MHAELDGPEARALADAVHGPARVMYHVCGICKTCHKVEGGRLVKLTPAELFELHMERPRTMQAIADFRAPTTPPGRPAATLITNQDAPTMSATDLIDETDDGPDVPALGTCCICGGSRDVWTILQLHKLCPTPGRGWGCVVCGRPCDGALAVVCNACCDARGDEIKRVAADLQFACKGYPGKDGRLPIGQLAGRFDHDMTKHPEEAGHG